MALTGILPIFMCFLVLLMAACGSGVVQEVSTHETDPCHIVYDAGSSGTRMFIYQQSEDGWIQNRGPKTGALADPVRQNRGKTMDDAGQVIEELVATLDQIRMDGPLDEDGKAEWPAFDWQHRCSLQAVTVYATAGMRLAEQQDPMTSRAFWDRLNARLADRVGIPVTTRTISGFEEGLYAWLTVREGKADNHFGTAEMGGASVQITFPCEHCEMARSVRVADMVMPLFSHSFLDWGQDEAWNRFGRSPACARGVGLEKPGWQVADCEAAMGGFQDTASEVEQYLDDSAELAWYTGGAFRYMNDTDIDQFCRHGTDSGFQPVSSCFRAVYLPYVLDSLGLPAEYEAVNLSWTLGAVVCTATRCLEVN
jgi:hypothetical protein